MLVVKFKQFMNLQKNNPHVKKIWEKNISSKSVYEYFKIKENYLVL